MRSADRFRGAEPVVEIRLGEIRAMVDAVISVGYPGRDARGVWPRWLENARTGS